MRYIFILNPKAGQGGVEDTLRSAIDRLPEKDSCSIYLTQGIEDATRFVRQWCQDNPDEEVRFIACGGDGTISEVFNGAVGFENVSVSVYPCGSGNDFVKTFGGKEKFLNVEKLIHAPVQKLDLLKAGNRYSVNVLNFGFDTTVAITINAERSKTGHGNKNAYAKGVVIALINSMKNRFTVTADGEVLNPDGKGLLCTLGNGQYVGGSFKCAPRASTSDGLMEVCLIKPISRIRFLMCMSAYIAGRHLDSPTLQGFLTYRQARSVRVQAPEGFAYSLDGEIIYENDFTVEVVEHALNLAVPE